MDKLNPVKPGEYIKIEEKATVKAEEAEKVEGAERLEKAEGEAEGGAVEEQASSAGRKKRQVRAGHDRGTSKTRP